MTVKDEMLKSRDKAGARYLAAAQELRAAFVDLFAYDIALANRHYGVGDEIRTFDSRQAQEGVPAGLLHPQFCKRGDVEGAWQKDAEAKGAEYFAALESGAA